MTDVKAATAATVMSARTINFSSAAPAVGHFESDFDCLMWRL
jgi:hypothetical protein